MTTFLSRDSRPICGRLRGPDGHPTKVGTSVWSGLSVWM